MYRPALEASRDTSFFLRHLDYKRSPTPLCDSAGNLSAIGTCDLASSFELQQIPIGGTCDLETHPQAVGLRSQPRSGGHEP